MPELHEDPLPGAGLVNVTFAGTGLLVGTSVAGAAAPDTVAVAHAVLSCVLFAIGTGGFLWAYALGVSRSRVDLVNIPGLFFLAGDTAPGGSVDPSTWPWPSRSSRSWPPPLSAPTPRWRSGSWRRCSRSG